MVDTVSLPSRKKVALGYYADLQDHGKHPDFHVIGAGSRSVESGDGYSVNSCTSRFSKRTIVSASDTAASRRLTASASVYSETRKQKLALHQTLVAAANVAAANALASGASSYHHDRPKRRRRHRNRPYRDPNSCVTVVVRIHPEPSDIPKCIEVKKSGSPFQDDDSADNVENDEDDYDNTDNTFACHSVRIFDPYDPDHIDPPREQEYFFDQIFDANVSQDDFYATSIAPVVERSCCHGLSATVVAYGETCTGKTFTLLGPELRELKDEDHAKGPTVTPDVTKVKSSVKTFPRVVSSSYSCASSLASTLVSCPTEDDRSTVGSVIHRELSHEVGVIPRALFSVFRLLESMKQTIESDTCKYTFCVRVQFLEIYNNEIRDLLEDNAKAAGTKSPSKVKNTKSAGKVTLRWIGPDPPQIIGVHNPVVSTASEAWYWLRSGRKRRQTARMARNARSSRSHAIFSVIIEQRTILAPNKATGSGEHVVVQESRSKLNFVDLAAPQRNPSGTDNKKLDPTRLKEQCEINQSLLTLRLVIYALVEQQNRMEASNSPNRKSTPQKRIPYRDSKLTSLLQSSLGGDHKVVMIACVSPAARNIEQSWECLKYMDRIQHIANKPSSHVDQYSPKNADDGSQSCTSTIRTRVTTVTSTSRPYNNNNNNYDIVSPRPILGLAPKQDTKITSTGSTVTTANPVTPSRQGTYTRSGSPTSSARRVHKISESESPKLSVLSTTKAKKGRSDTRFLPESSSEGDEDWDATLDAILDSNGGADEHYLNDQNRPSINVVIVTPSPRTSKQKIEKTKSHVTNGIILHNRLTQSNKPSTIVTAIIGSNDNSLDVPSLDPRKVGLSRYGLDRHQPTPTTFKTPDTAMSTPSVAPVSIIDNESDIQSVKHDIFSQLEQGTEMTSEISGIGEVSEISVADLDSRFKELADVKHNQPPKLASYQSTAAQSVTAHSSKNSILPDKNLSDSPHSDFLQSNTVYGGAARPESIQQDTIHSVLPQHDSTHQNKGHPTESNTTPFTLTDQSSQNLTTEINSCKSTEIAMTTNDYLAFLEGAMADEQVTTNSVDCSSDLVNTTFETENGYTGDVSTYWKSNTSSGSPLSTSACVDEQPDEQIHSGEPLQYCNNLTNDSTIDCSFLGISSDGGDPVIFRDDEDVSSQQNSACDVALDWPRSNGIKLTLDNENHLWRFVGMVLLHSNVSSEPECHSFHELKKRMRLSCLDRHTQEPQCIANEIRKAIYSVLESDRTSNSTLQKIVTCYNSDPTDSKDAELQQLIGYWVCNKQDQSERDTTEIEGKVNISDCLHQDTLPLHQLIRSLLLQQQNKEDLSKITQQIEMRHDEFIIATDGLVALLSHEGNTKANETSVLRIDPNHDSAKGNDTLERYQPENSHGITDNVDEILKNSNEELNSCVASSSNCCPPSNLESHVLYLDASAIQQINGDVSPAQWTKNFEEIDSDIETMSASSSYISRPTDNNLVIPQVNESNVVNDGLSIEHNIDQSLRTERNEHKLVVEPCISVDDGEPIISENDRNESMNYNVTETRKTFSLFSTNNATKFEDLECIASSEQEQVSENGSETLLSDVVSVKSSGSHTKDIHLETSNAAKETFSTPSVSPEAQGFSDSSKSSTSNKEACNSANEVSGSLEIDRINTEVYQEDKTFVPSTNQESDSLYCDDQKSSTSESDVIVSSSAIQDSSSYQPENATFESKGDTNISSSMDMSNSLLLSNSLNKESCTFTNLVIMKDETSLQHPIVSSSSPSILLSSNEYNKCVSDTVDPSLNSIVDRGENEGIQKSIESPSQKLSTLEPQQAIFDAFSQNVESKEVQDDYDNEPHQNEVSQSEHCPFIEDTTASTSSCSDHVVYSDESIVNTQPLLTPKENFIDDKPSIVQGNDMSIHNSTKTTQGFCNLSLGDNTHPDSQQLDQSRTPGLNYPVDIPSKALKSSFVEELELSDSSTVGKTENFPSHSTACTNSDASILSVPEDSYEQMSSVSERRKVNFSSRASLIEFSTSEEDNHFEAVEKSTTNYDSSSHHMCKNETKVDNIPLHDAPHTNDTHQLLRKQHDTSAEMEHDLLKQSVALEKVKVNMSIRSFGNTSSSNSVPFCHEKISSLMAEPELDHDCSSGQVLKGTLQNVSILYSDSSSSSENMINEFDKAVISESDCPDAFIGHDYDTLDAIEQKLRLGLELTEDELALLEMMLETQSLGNVSTDTPSFPGIQQKTILLRTPNGLEELIPKTENDVCVDPAITLEESAISTASIPSPEPKVRSDRDDHTLSRIEIEQERQRQEDFASAVAMTCCSITCMGRTFEAYYYDYSDQGEPAVPSSRVNRPSQKKRKSWMSRVMGLADSPVTKLPPPSFAGMMPDDGS